MFVQLTVIWIAFVSYGDGRSGSRSSTASMGQPTDDFRINKFTINSTEAMRFAKVEIVCSVENLAEEDKEFNFNIRIPKTAFISSFFMKFGDEELHADVVEKKNAKNIYDEAKNKSMTAGHVTQQTTVEDDKDRDIFDISVNIVKQSTVEFCLQYHEFIERHAGVYSQTFYISPRQMISNIQVSGVYSERQDFKKFSFNSPSQTTVLNNTSYQNNGFFIKKIDWKPNSETAITEDLEDYNLEVNFELEPLETGGQLIYNENGDFAHYFSAECDSSNILPKRIVFVVDISGSMAGYTFRQVKIAIDIILDQLRVTDFFNFVFFEKDVFVYKTAFIPATDSNIEAAKEHMKRVNAEGGTNMNDALMIAGRMFRSYVGTNESFANVIVFLTDGEPTVGVTNKKSLRRNLLSSNYINGTTCCVAYLFTIAFSKSPDIPFLRQLTNDQSGSLRVIRQNLGSQIGEELVDLYSEIHNPYYRNVRFSYFDNGQLLPDNNITQSYFLNYFCGAEIVVGGSTRPMTQVTPQVTVDGAKRTLTFSTISNLPSSNVDKELLSRLVAYKKVKELLKTAGALTKNKTAVALARDEALQLAIDNSFVTPVTSLVVALFKPESNSNSDNQLSSNSKPQTSRTGALGKKVPDQLFSDFSEEYEVNSELSIRNNAISVRGSKIFAHILVVLLAIY